jgi:hypothetical protein
MSDRAWIARAFDYDEQYDDDPEGDPPITVRGYRRACRVLTMDFLEEVAAPPDWSAEECSAFESGVSATVDTMRSRLVTILTGPSSPRDDRSLVGRGASTGPGTGPIQDGERRSDRTRIALAIERDESFDAISGQDGAGDPPIRVWRYRRGCRALVTTDFLELVTAPGDWSMHRTLAFAVGASATVDAVMSRMATAIRGPRLLAVEHRTAGETD